MRFELANLEALKEKLAQTSIKITKPLGANGALFGSVSKDDIAEALKSQAKIEIDKKSIENEGAIKATGGYEISVKLGHGIHGVFELIVKGK